MTSVLQYHTIPHKKQKTANYNVSHTKEKVVANNMLNIV
jgi:hypothetical protein